VAGLSAGELLKYPGRLKLFIRKYRDGEAFELVSGGMVNLIFESGPLELLESGDATKIKSIRFHEDLKNRKGQPKTFTTGKFKKTAEFGGGAKGGGTQYEDMVVDALNRDIINMGGEITIVVGGKQYKGMTRAIKVTTDIKRAGGASSDPKADIIICRDEKSPLGPDNIYISHKKAGGPEAFQQYGGLTESAGRKIYNHAEVQEFLRVTAKYVGPGGLTSPIMKPVKDRSLILMSIYGPEAISRKFSLQHTQLIGQGDPILRPRAGGVFMLDFSSHMSVSGDLSHFIGGYEPVFGATFRNGRGFTVDGKRLTGVRVGIYPKQLVANRKGLIIL
jgi:hypothetical protein